MLHRCQVEHDIRAAAGPFHPVLVPHVADEETQQVIVVQFMRHFKLLAFVTAQDTDHGRFPRHQQLDDPAADRTGAANHQNGLSLKMRSHVVTSARSGSIHSLRNRPYSRISRYPPLLYNASRRRPSRLNPIASASFCIGRLSAEVPQ